MLPSRNDWWFNTDIRIPLMHPTETNVGIKEPLATF